MNNDPTYIRRAYMIIHALLWLAMLALPLPTLFLSNPMLNDALLPIWQMCAAMALIAAVSTDSMLYPILSGKSVTDAVIWVFFLFVYGLLVVSRYHSAWGIGILFLIHSFRAAYPLFRQKEAYWWLWPAWLRDTSAAMLIFILTYLLN